MCISKVNKKMANVMGNAGKAGKNIGGFVVTGFIFLVVVILFFNSFYIVSAGERGILSTFGDPNMNAKTEGLHLMIPIVQGAVIMDVKTQKYEADASAASNDLQVVTTKIAVNYHLTPESVPSLYKNIGLDYRERVIQPAVQEVVKASTAKYTAEQLLTKRAECKEAILQGLKDRLLERGIIVEDISIVNFDFSQSFNEAIEAKVTAEQNALAAKNKLEQVKFEAEMTVTKAKAEAEALSLQKAQVSAELIQLRQLEVQKLAIEKWNGVMPQITGGVMPFIDINTMVSAKTAASA
jgi:regulator of protease activity HflC (stomatin/prohibitin superfamily)